MITAKNLLNFVHTTAVFNRRVKTLAKHIESHLRDGTVLDVGCGDGTLAQSIMELNPKLEFKGIDVFLRPSVAIPAKAYNGKTIPNDDNSVDWITVCDVLHHTDDPIAILRECARVARHGVVVKDHLRKGLFAESTLRIMDWVGNRGHGVRLPYNYLSENEWNLAFAQANLETRRWDDHLCIYPFPFTLLFDRKLHFVTTLSLRAED